MNIDNLNETEQEIISGLPQIFGDDVLKVTDDMWVSRWLMEKICDT